MANTDSTLEYDNVNGVTLSLKVDMRHCTPLSRLFTVSYKSTKNKSPWPKLSLFLAIFFNILALCYIRISLTAILIIVSVLSFLVFFWVTHSVQSESVLVVPSVGIQSTVKYVFGREDSFTPWSSVDDIIINEVIKLNRVLYFLTILVKSNNSHTEPTKLIPLFKYTKPRLRMLEAIYSELQILLTEALRQPPNKEAGGVG